MRQSRWTMPGPAGFVQHAVNSVEDRLCAVLAVPMGMASDLAAHFAAQCRRAEIHFADETVDPDRDPLDQLWQRYVDSTDSAATFVRLCQEPALAGETIFVTASAGPACTAWLAATDGFQQEAGRIKPFERPTIVIIVEGVEPSLLPQDTPFIKRHVYDGWAGTRDTLAYATFLDARSDSSPWHSDLKAAVVAHLAQWDSRLCERLARLSLEQLLRNWSAAVEDFARDWQGAADGGDVARWEYDQCQQTGDRPVYHSAWLISQGRRREVERRVWHAQLSIVYPLLEELRQKVVEWYDAALPLPVVNGFGDQVTDPHDLELNTIKWMADTGEFVMQADHRRLLNQACRMRNLLAHLTVLSAEDILTFKPRIM